MGTHLRVLSESFLMNTNMTGFRRLCRSYYSYVTFGFVVLINTPNLYFSVYSKE